MHYIVNRFGMQSQNVAIKTAIAQQNKMKQCWRNADPPSIKTTLDL